MKRSTILLVGSLMLGGPLLAGYSFIEARRDPVVRTATLALPDWPAGAPPVRAVLAQR